MERTGSILCIKKLSTCDFLYNISSKIDQDGTLEIDNNAAERSIKPFVLGRKNWLFSASTKGAESSALLYSLIETAKNNNLVVEKYLLYLMDSFSKIDPKDKESLLKILPNSKDLPNDLKIKVKK